MPKNLSREDVNELALDILNSLHSAQRAYQASQGLYQTYQLRTGWRENLLPQMRVPGIVALFTGSTVPVGNEADAKQRLQDMTNQTPDITRMHQEVLDILKDCQEIHGRQAGQHQCLLRNAWDRLELIRNRQRDMDRRKQATLSEYLQ